MAVAVTAGGHHSLGLKSTGSIVVWGRDNFNQCQVPAPNTDFVAVAAGDRHSLGLKWAIPIPTVSEWGMVAMTLLLLTAGTLVFLRRPPASA